MKKHSLSQLRKKKNTAFRSLIMLGLMLFLVQPLVAQFYTKVETGELVETQIKTYSASFADYNNDGFDDVLIVGTTDYPSTLFINNGDGTFTEQTENVIYTTSGPSIAATWGDYNNDGNIDLYICNTGNSGDPTAANFLFRNDGDGNFTRILEGEIVTDMDWSLGAAWADYDNDGFLDLYVSNFMQENRLYKNNGDGTFTKITEGDIVNDNNNTYSASWVDYDNDGFQDLYVVNYFYSELPGQNNCLYRNNGDGTFTKNTTSLIANDAALTQGSSWGDFNNDGLMDVYVTVNDYADVKHNLLYKNIGNGEFELVDASPSTDGGQTFGAAWLDIDNDGFLDLTVSNNGGSQMRYNNLYKNNGDETFTDQIDDITTQIPLRDFSSTVADFNNDGYPDIFTPSFSTTLSHGLYKNNGGDNNWISLRLEGVISNRSAIGARIYCYANDMMQTRAVSSTTGQYTGSSLVQIFGIGAATEIDRIEIHWPSGIHQVISGPEINQIHQIQESIESNATAILTFSLEEETGDASIDSLNHTVAVEVENGTDLTALTPEITVSAGASISPGSGESVDFSNGAVSYTVTAENGTDSQIWMVTVTDEPLGTDVYNYKELLTIYPNPAKTDGEINIIASETGMYELNVVNYIGQKIKNLKVNLQSGEDKSINLGALEQGIYILQIKSNGKQGTHKLIITN
ncbi:MAG TPA: FG-GAP-like repeat-containing protein [Mariniphaga sp.]|nr:FG-GAP-like repeat-containing protein [Mariniphaga sp.]